MKKQLNQLREFFWPILDPLQPRTEHTDEQVIQIHIHDEHIDTAFDPKLKLASNEEERRKGVEAKATMLISSISLATTLIVGADTFLGTGYFFWPRVALKAILVILCCYTVATVIYALKCLSRGSYHTLGFEDINKNHAGKIYKRELIRTMQNHRKKNQATINKKVDCMVMAQEFYKRSVITIALYVLCGLIITIVRPDPMPPNVPATTILHDNTKPNPTIQQKQTNIRP